MRSARALGAWGIIQVIRDSTRSALAPISQGSDSLRTQVAEFLHPSPTVIPDPHTGRRLHVATLQASTPAICPACSCHADGGFVSFEDDLRIAYACPRCMELVWIKGA